MSHANELAKTAPLLRCHACAGTFSLGHTEDGAPLAMHSPPYCAAFDRISTTNDAVQFSERCRAAYRRRGCS